MPEEKIYNFPGGVCPVCEHSPLDVRTYANEYNKLFVSYYCPECGRNEMLPLSKNTDKESRNSKCQIDWAKRVKERDRYACVICGETENIDAHHLIPVSAEPKLQGRIGNGITLCRRCHKLVHNKTMKWPEIYK